MLINEFPQNNGFEFYSKAKTEICEIKTMFEKMRETSKKWRKVTFDNSETVAFKINEMMNAITKTINDCELAVRENGSIFSIDKSLKTKNMVGAMQTHLSYELAKLKNKCKLVAEEMSQRNKANEPSYMDNSKFSFISEDRGTKGSVYEVRDSQIRFQEINCQENNQYEGMCRNVLELSRIMRDFEEISLDQGCLVDRIDLNISATLSCAKKGNLELMAADTMLRKDCGDKILRILLLANLALFVLIILKFLNPIK